MRILRRRRTRLVVDMKHNRTGTGFVLAGCFLLTLWLTLPCNIIAWCLLPLPTPLSRSIKTTITSSSSSSSSSSMNRDLNYLRWCLLATKGSNWNEDDEEEKHNDCTNLNKDGDDEDSGHSDNSTDNNSKEEVLERKIKKSIRIQQAKEKIDEIRKHPDAPFDIDEEMKKVIGMPPSTTSQQSEEQEQQEEEEAEEEQMEAQIMELEEQLYDAVKQQNYKEASKLSKEISNTKSMDDWSCVLQVNSAFYKAFSNKDYDHMSNLWLPCDHTAVCIHPIHSPLVGVKSILQGWHTIFQSAENKAFHRNWMEPHNVRCVLKGTSMAIVTCDEHIFGRRFVRGKKRQTELLNKCTATNIFRKLKGQWYICYHHAAWHPDSAPAKQFLLSHPSQQQQQQQQNQPTQQNPITTSRIFRISDNADLQDLFAGDDDNFSTNDDNDNLDPIDDSVDMTIDGILGTHHFGPILGTDDDLEDHSSSQNIQQGPIKRVVMGSLSDLFNGGLADLLGSSSNSNTGTPINFNGKPKAIIHFSSVNNHDDQDDMDDIDDDDIHHDLDHIDDHDDHDDDHHQDDDNDDKNHHDQDGVMALVNKLNQHQPKDNDLSTIKPSSKSSDDSSSRTTTKTTTTKTTSKYINNNTTPPSPPPQKDALRQNCIMALRKLCQQGTISPKQKRILLTDIITCSAKGEFSMVEVAYELLCGSEAFENHDHHPIHHIVDTITTETNIAKDLAEEEFADQCRVFSIQLEEQSLLFTPPTTRRNDHNNNNNSYPHSSHSI